MINKKELKKKYDTIYDYVGDFHEGLAIVWLNNKWGFIDKEGKEVIPLKYDSIFNFCEELAGVKLNNKWGFINKEGKVVIPLKYDWANYFDDGSAEVKLNGKYRYINKKGIKIQLKKGWDNMDKKEIEMKGMRLFAQGNGNLLDIADYVIYKGKIMKKRRDFDIDIITNIKNNVVIITEDDSVQLLRFDERKLKAIKDLSIYNIDEKGYVSRKIIHKLIGKFEEIDGEETENMQDFRDKYGIIGSNTADEGDIEIYYGKNGDNYAILHDSIPYHGRNINKDINKNSQRFNDKEIASLIGNIDLGSRSSCTLSELFEELVTNKVLTYDEVKDIIINEGYGEIKESIDSYSDLIDNILEDKSYSFGELSREALDILSEDQAKTVLNSYGWYQLYSIDYEFGIAILIDDKYLNKEND